MSWFKDPNALYKSSQCCAPDFFPQKTLGDGPAFWIFFPGFTDKG